MPVQRWSQAFPEAVLAARPFIVHLQAANPERETFSTGSGVVLDNYHVLTVAQVAGPEDEVTLLTATGRRLTARPLAVDPVYLLTVLRLENRLDLGPAPIVPAEALRPGQPVLSAGCPLGMDVAVSQGVVSMVDLTVYRQDRIPVDGLIVTDAALHPGNVGGPLISAAGEIVGINTAPWVPGFSLAVQGEVAARLANQIIEFGSATHPWLGFSGQPEIIDRELSQLFALPADRGLVVSHVVPGGPGEKAGLQVFDMVVRIGGTPVSTVGLMRKLLSLHRPGDKVRVTVLRGGNLFETSFPVEEIPTLSGS